MEFLGHVWTLKEIFILIMLPCAFVGLHEAMKLLWDSDYKRNKRE